jgi:hypothetical protein
MWDAGTHAPGKAPDIALITLSACSSDAPLAKERAPDLVEDLLTPEQVVTLSLRNAEQRVAKGIRVERAGIDNNREGHLY